MKNWVDKVGNMYNAVCLFCAVICLFFYYNYNLL